MQSPQADDKDYLVAESTTPVNTVKVLYIAGWGRSGSTILGRILGQVEGFSSVGELRYIWDRGLVENRLCGCGARFSECPVWSEVVRRVLDADGGISAEELIDLRQRAPRTRHVLLAPTRERLEARMAGMHRYLETLEILYRTVQEVNRSEVIVDTSKVPSYGYALQNTPGIELYVLHLVRDPRAVAYSWASRKKARVDRSGGQSGVMTPHGFVESSLVWDTWNLAVERVWSREPQRYMRLRYEDFVENPRSSVGSILQFLGVGATQTPFQDERSTFLDVSHAFSGNPDRFFDGVVTIKADEEWKREMSTARQGLVTALTWPGAIRYGYPIGPEWPATQRS